NKPTLFPYTTLFRSEATEEELLGDRRDHAHEHGRGHQRRRALADAELAGQLVAAVQLERRGVQRRDHVVTDPGEHEASQGFLQGRAPEPEVRRAWSPVQRREIDRGEYEREVEREVRSEAHGRRRMCQRGATELRERADQNRG